MIWFFKEVLSKYLIFFFSINSNIRDTSKFSLIKQNFFEIISFVFNIIIDEIKY